MRKAALAGQGSIWLAKMTDTANSTWMNAGENIKEQDGRENRCFQTLNFVASFWVTGQR
ncbi:hypothetical protein ACFPYJ_19435 [Paenibacillus solisilvae]|uniref:Uncharacterized protein n=1 Tax=Paenibacillus solisilvae TaxID=2486751 RepID=A0ABW0W2E6_9BACL